MKKFILLFTAVFAVMTMTLAFSPSAKADYYTSSQTLRYGMQNSEVTNLQVDLKRLGFFYGSATGYFGSITRQSVINFQKSKSLTADGVVGRMTARAIKVDTVIATAKSLQGVPYVWGGNTPSGFDCSGFTSYVMAQNDITVPRTSALQYQNGISIEKSSLQRGDLVFFTTYAPGASHVGIYLGNDQFIHASSGAGKIIISQLFSNPYYAQHYIGARRVI